LYGYPPQTIGLKKNTPLFRILSAKAKKEDQRIPESR